MFRKLLIFRCIDVKMKKSKEIILLKSKKSKEIICLKLKKSKVIILFAFVMIHCLNVQNAIFAEKRARF